MQHFLSKFLLGGSAVIAMFTCASPTKAATIFGDQATLQWGAITTPGGSFGIDSTGPSGIADAFGPTTIQAPSTLFAAALGTDVTVWGDGLSISEGSAVSTSFTAGLPFNGFILHDQKQKFTSESLASSTLAGFTASDITLNNGDLWVNLGGLSISGNDHVDINFGASVSPVPLPGSMCLFTSALMAMTGIASVRKGRSRTT